MRVHESRLKHARVNHYSTATFAYILELLDNHMTYNNIINNIIVHSGMVANTLTYFQISYVKPTYMHDLCIVG